MSTNIHAAYAAISPLWSKVRTAYAGQDAIKARTTDFLPDFVPPNAARYEVFLAKAPFLGVTSYTTDKLTGAAYRKEPVVEVPSEVEFMIDDMDGAGSSALQVSKGIVFNNTLIGRHGMLMDYQSADPNMSAEDEAVAGLRAFSRAYPAESIIDWDDKNGKLTYVRLREVVTVRSEDRQTVTDEKWERELYIDEDGYYKQQLWREGSRFGDVIEPRFGNSRFTEIPFVIVGSTDNLPSVDKIPMLDIANTNITHYQVSAYWMENLATHGQMTLGVDPGEMTHEQIEAVSKTGISVGSPNGTILGKGGKFTTVSAPESNSLDTARKQLLEDITAIGASLLNPSMANESATSANINASGQVSVMQNIVSNSSDAMERLLRWGYMFTTGREPMQDSISYKINTEFFDKSIDPQIMAQALLWNQSGLMLSEEMDEIKALGFGIDVATDSTEQASIAAPANNLIE